MNNYDQKGINDGFDIKHYKDKQKRVISMNRQKKHIQKQLYSLSHHWGWYKTSVWVGIKWDNTLNTYIDTRIERENRSKRQKTLKKIASKRVRQLSLDETPTKGCNYKKVFDYRWIWYRFCYDRRLPDEDRWSY